MFTKARIKLTSQYVAIIMLVSFSFSVFLYKSISSDFQRRLNVIENRLNQKAPRGWRIQGPVHEYFLQDLHDARTGLLLMLVYANGMILLLSFAAGYYLAGKTLTPIEKAMNKQKRFIADAGHELKTPLTALHTSIEVALRDKNLNLKEARKVLKSGLDDVEGLNKLANDLIRLNLYQVGNGVSSERVNTKNVCSERIVSHLSFQHLSRTTGRPPELEESSLRFQVKASECDSVHESRDSSRLLCRLDWTRGNPRRRFTTVEAGRKT